MPLRKKVIPAMWPFRKKKKQIHGFIGASGLTDWWLTEFDDDERAHILATFQPMGASDGGRMLIEEKPSGDVSNPSHLLSTLATWFKHETDRTIGFRIIDKAEELLAASENVLTKHFTYQAKAMVYYRWRDTDSFALERAETACRDQIQLAPLAAEAFLAPAKRPFIEIDWFEDSKEEAQRKIDLVRRGEARFDRHPLDTLPSHHGYKQLAIILEKRGDYVAAGALSEQAREQGWKGDWDARIARLNRRIAKLSN